MRCKSVRFPDQPYYQCPLKTDGDNEFCEIHKRYVNKEKYFDSNQNDVFDTDKKRKNHVHYTLFKDVVIGTVKENSDKTVCDMKRNDTDTNRKTDGNTIPILDMGDDNMDIKNTMIRNHPLPGTNYSLPENYVLNINDVENKYDPYTFEQIWDDDNGIRIWLINPSIYFFYRMDDKKEVYAISIFSLKGMVDNKEYFHPDNGKELSIKDRIRASRFVIKMNRYYNLFSTEVTCNSNDYIIAQFTQFFKNFHKNNIYLEPNWIDYIDNYNKLNKVVVKLNHLIKNNIDDIIFTYKFENFLSEAKLELLKFMAKVYSEYELSRSIFGWIIAESLSEVCDKVVEKYTCLKNMFE